MLDLLSLPRDVKTQIFTFIRQRVDRLSICLTCKDLHTAILPQIYSTVKLHDNLPMGKVSAPLSSENLGLKYIKNVRIASGKYFGLGSRSRFTNILFLLANHLLRNTLLSFDVNTTKSCDDNVLDVLLARQRNIHTLRLHDCMSIPRKFEINSEKLSTLQLLIDNGCNLGYAEKWIRTILRLQVLELYIDVKRYCERHGKNHDDEDERARICETTMTEVLSMINSDAQWQPLHPAMRKRLSALRLHGVYLKLAAKLISEAIDLAAVNELSLQNCKHEVSLFKLMTSNDEAARPSLRRLEVLHTEDVRIDQDETDIFNEFLYSFSTLESLIIHASGSYNLIPSLRSVLKHRSQLRSLYLHHDRNGDSTQLRQQWADANQDLHACCKLEQLAMNFPDLYLEGTVEDYPIHNFLYRTCRQLKSLRTLRMLNISAYAGMSDEILVGYIASQYVKARLKSTAKHVFDVVSHLNVLSLGMNGVRFDFGREEHLLEQSTYVRADVKDIGGRMSVEAIEVDNGDARELEPLAEILDVHASDPDVLFQKYGNG